MINGNLGAPTNVDIDAQAVPVLQGWKNLARKNAVNAEVDGEGGSENTNAKETVAAAAATLRRS